MTLRTRIRLLLPILALTSVVSFAGAQQPAATINLQKRAARPDDSGRSADHGWHAAERPALLRSREQTAAGAGRASARGEGRFGARRRRPAGAGAFRRAHGVQRHAAFSEAGDRELHAGARHAVRRACERAHQLRRDGVRAADPDRQSGGHGSVAHHPRRLRAQRVVRRGRDRQRARRHSRGVAAGARSRRADTGRADARAAEGLALR